MNNRLAILLAIANGFLCSSYAYGQDLFSPGIYSKLSGGASLTQSRSAESLTSNPANLSLIKGHQVYYEVDMMKFRYLYIPLQEKYTSPEMNITAPPSYVGWAWSGKKWSAGTILIPTGTGTTMTVEQVPIKQGGDTQVYDTKITPKGFKTGLGGAYRVNRQLRLGASLIYRQDSTQMEAYQDETQQMSTKFKGEGYRVHLGGRYSLFKNRLIFASHYSPSHQRKSKGEIKMGNTINTKTEAITYEPEILGIGAQAQRRKLGAFAEYSKYRYSKGRSIQRTGLPGEAQETDLVDVNKYSLGTFVRFKRNTFSMGYTYRNGNRGNGVMGKDKDGFDTVLVEGGKQFGDFNAIERHNYSGGWLIKNKSYQVGVTANYIFGSRVVPKEANGAGGYQYNIYMIGIGGIKKL